MQFLKTLFWVILAVVLVLFAHANWNVVTLNLWGGLQADVKLPVLVIGAFVLPGLTVGEALLAVLLGSAIGNAMLGVAGTYWSVLLPMMISPFGIYLARVFAVAAVRPRSCKPGGQRPKSRLHFNPPEYRACSVSNAPRALLSRAYAWRRTLPPPKACRSSVHWCARAAAACFR